MSFEIITKLVKDKLNKGPSTDVQMPEPIDLKNFANLAVTFDLGKEFPSLKDKDLKSIYSLDDPSIIAKHKNFDPKEVLEIINLIEKDLKDGKVMNIPTEKYEGLYDENNGKHKNIIIEQNRTVELRKASFIERLIGKQAPSKKIVEIYMAQVRAYPNKVMLAYWMPNERKYIEMENIVLESPELYALERQGNEMKKGKKLKWTLKKTTLLDELSNELENIKTLANFAISYGYRIKFIVI